MFTLDLAIGIGLFLVYWFLTGSFTKHDMQTYLYAIFLMFILVFLLSKTILIGVPYVVGTFVAASLLNFISLAIKLKLK